jgi:hypothetical protein
MGNFYSGRSGRKEAEAAGKKSEQEAEMMKCEISCKGSGSEKSGSGGKKVNRKVFEIISL